MLTVVFGFAGLCLCPFHWQHGTCESSEQGDPFIAVCVHCWRQTRPLHGSVVPAQDLRAHPLSAKKDERRTSIRRWKVLMKDVDLGESKSFLDNVYLGCTQRECQTSKDMVDNFWKNV